MAKQKREFFSSVELGQIAQIACLLEVRVPKPGNVSPDQDYKDLTYEDFLYSAAAVGSAVEHCSEMGLGEAVLQAVRDTRKYVSSNTNLGIILLIMPLAQAYENLKEKYLLKNLNRRDMVLKLRHELKELLSGLTVTDAEKTYEAIRRAEPAGMGKVEKADIEEESPEITLKEAMRLSQRRDNIAREYVTDFEIIFNIGYPTFEEKFNKLNLKETILETFITILAHIPDTLIMRKAGRKAAEEVTTKAQKILSRGGVTTEKGRQMIAELDDELQDEDNVFNPGTTADLITGVIFAYILISGKKFFHD